MVKIVLALGLGVPLYAQFTQFGNKTTVSDNIGAAGLGHAVALSRDGKTAVVGGNTDNSNAGAAWIFVQSSGVWNEQAKLTPSDSVGAAAFGWSVAISGDGNTVLIGGNTDSSSTGAAWVFKRSGTTWIQQTKLIGAGAVGGSRQGDSVALSADGNTALVGGSGDNSFAGATWVFVQNAGVWSPQGGKLIGTGGLGIQRQGSSVALSGDANTALIGGPGDANGAGAAWVFKRSNGQWTQTDRLLGLGFTGAANQGTAVALSDDGNTALSGGPQDHSGIGATWVFAHSGGGWTQQAMLVGTGALTAANQGSSVAISGDGNLAIVGGPADVNTGAGASWAFSRTGAGWTQLGGKLVGTGAFAGSSSQGRSVAISWDGTTALVGGPTDRINNVSGAGAFWTFTAPPTCIYSLSPSSVNLASGSGTFAPITGSFTLTATNCTAANTWTAASSATWLSITSGTSGNGATPVTTISYSAFTNSVGAPRTASITVAGKTFLVTQAPSTETQAQRVVRALYHSILGREPDPGGFVFWTGSGAPTNTSGAVLYNQMADGFYTSPEFTGSGWEALSIYQAALGRQPLFAEWAQAVAQIRSGALTTGQLVSNLAAASSNLDFVQSAILNAYGRRATPDEITTYTNQLNASTSPNPKLDFLDNVIFRSNEFRLQTNGQFVTMLYFTILLRDTDSGGYTFWQSQVAPPNGQPGIFYLYNPQPVIPPYTFKLAVIGQAVPPNPNLLGFLGSPEFQGLIQ